MIALIRPLEAIGLVVGGFGLVCSVGLNLALSLAIAKTPRTPDPARGLVVPERIRDGVHFVSRNFEACSHYGILAEMAFVALLGAAVISLVARSRH